MTTRRPSPRYELRRFSQPTGSVHFTTHVASRSLDTGTTRAKARREALALSLTHPTELVTLVREARILTTFRKGRAMRAAALAQAPATLTQ